MTGPLPVPSPSGARVAGDRYQWLVAWHACLTVLHDAAIPAPATQPSASASKQTTSATSMTSSIRRRRPPHSYKQVKYAVDSHTPVNGGYLTAPSKADGPSILAKIAAAWHELTATGDPVELAIITNRAPDPADPLISGRDARTRLLLPRASAGGPASARGKARAAWAKAASLTEAELLDLLAVLDFDLARDRLHLEETVKLTMFAAGLRSDDLALAAGADWVAQQVVAGQREFGLDAIQDAVSNRGLRAGPTRTIVSIATLTPDRLAAQAAHAIDWVDRFDGPDAYAKRRPKPPATWQQTASRHRGHPRPARRSIARRHHRQPPPRASLHRRRRAPDGHQHRHRRHAARHALDLRRAVHHADHADLRRIRHRARRRHRDRHRDRHHDDRRRPGVPAGPATYPSPG